MQFGLGDYLRINSI